MTKSTYNRLQDELDNTILEEFEDLESAGEALGFDASQVDEDFFVLKQEIGKCLTH